MQDLIHADIFFFVTSIAVVIFSVILVIAGVLVIQTLVEARAFVRRVRHETDRALDAAENAAASFAEKAGGIAGVVGSLGYRLWRAQATKAKSSKNKKSSK